MFKKSSASISARTFFALLLTASLLIPLPKFSSVHAAPLGTGECAQSVTDLTGSVVREGNYCLVAIKGPAVTSGSSGSWTVPVGVNKIEYLLVGGGGAGGFSAGGGAGGFFETSTPVNAYSGTQVSIAIGSGGAAGTQSSAAKNGSKTTFGAVSVGGGGGGAVLASELNAGSSVTNAVTGFEGSGGGAMASNLTSIMGNQSGSAASASLTPLETVTGQPAGSTGNQDQARNSGGSALKIFSYATYSGTTRYGTFIGGGGGGGAGASGGNQYWSSSATDVCDVATGKKICFAPGNGGNGLSTAFINQSASQSSLGIGQYVDSRTYFSGGGGGRYNFDSATNAFNSNYYSTFSYALGGTGGKGGGGGGYATGTSNSGGGGGGTGKAGGSGVVLIRYAIPQVLSVSATAQSSTEIDLTWVRQASGLEAISGYTIEKSLKGANTWTNANTEGIPSPNTANGTRVTGLVANTEYDFRVTPVFASGSGIVSAIVTAATSKSNQTVSWTPSNTNTSLANSPITPSSLATTNGDGIITYSIQSAGSTGCSVNSSSGVLTFSSTGNCVVRATASATTNYEYATKDVTFTITETITLPVVNSTSTATPSPSPSVKTTKKKVIKKSTGSKSATPKNSSQSPMNSVQPSPSPSATSSIPMNSQSASPIAVAPKSEFKALADAPYPGNGFEVPTPGQIITTVNNEVLETTVTQTSIDTKIELQDNSSLVLFTQNSQGSSIPVLGDGQIQIKDDSQVHAMLTGFQPNAPVEAWMFSSPIRLGGGATNASGEFIGQFAVDQDLPAGNHTLQINGLDTAGNVVSVAIGVTKTSDQNPLQVTESEMWSSQKQAATIVMATGAFVALVLVLKSYRRRQKN